MRHLATLAVAALLALAACGGDELQQFRDTADQAVQDVRDNVSADQLRERLDEVRNDLEQSDLPEDARRQLENARDELERALR